MAKFACTELVGNVCIKWEPMQAVSVLEALAITKQQADDIIVASLIVVFSAWALKQVANVIQRRRY